MKFSTWLRAEWDRVSGFGLIGLGALFVLLGYLGVRGTPFVADQMAYIASGGIGGLFCLGFGAALLLTADFHDEWRKLDRLAAELRGDAVPEPERDVEAELVGLSPEPMPGPASYPAGSGRVPVPEGAGTVGALAVALPRPAGGTRQALAIVSMILLLPLVVAGAGWRRASQTADLDIAARGLGVAVAAVAVGLAVLALWALWMRTSVLGRRMVVTGSLRRWNRQRSAVTPVERPQAGVDDDAVFVASGHLRFHRAGCAMLQWIDAAVPVPRDGIDADLSPCGLCETS